MTTHKHLKARVRARMAKTGERYAAARAHVAGGPSSAEREPRTVNGALHFPGIHPETTLLRILATHAGVRDPQGAPPTEEAMLAAGGGPGAGVFAFHYEKEQFSILYLAGRYRWEEPLAFVDGALRRLGLEPVVRETGSRKAADWELREALERGPVGAWVDLVELEYRGAPAEASGGGYHVLVVYGIEGDEAIVGDLTAEPLHVPVDVLARARARIAKQRNRLISVPRAARAEPLAQAMLAGLSAGSEALATESRRNFSLSAFADLADRMTARSGANSWARIFPRGRLLWTGLANLHRYVEAYSTGGGLLRPMIGRALAETARLTGREALDDVAARYAALGDAWTALTRAALPDEVHLFAETRRLQERMARRFADAGSGAEAEIRADAARLDELGRIAQTAFPLSETETAAFLEGLAGQLTAIHADEVTALERLRAATA